GFADDLERWLDGRVVRAQADTGWYRARRFVGRNKLPLAAAAAIFIALAVGLSLALWQAQRAREQAAYAGEQAKRAQDETETATTISNFVLSIIQQADPTMSQKTRLADIALLVAAARRIDTDLAGRPDLQLRMRLAIAAAYRNRGEGPRAL